MAKTKEEERADRQAFLATRPQWQRGDRVNVDGIGEDLMVLSVKSGASAWWVEAQTEDRSTWSVPSERVWV